MGPAPLVSIVIPAYKAIFFEEALLSAFAQDYPALEIVIGDDCPTTAITEIVERLRPRSPWPIEYVRNATQLREAPNVTACVRRARGQYIKFLYDDDLLEPQCVRRLVETLEEHPGLALVAARRRLIDELGQVLPDTYATRFDFTESVRLRGPELTSFIAEYTWNFIGEPTSVLCRRDDLLAFGDSIFGLDGQHISWVGDLAIYAKLMRNGDLAMLDEVLTSYRVSTQQVSQQGRENVEAAGRFHALFRQLLAGLGWVRPASENRLVHVAPLANAAAGRDMDMVAYLAMGRWSETPRQFNRWLQQRRLGEATLAAIAEHAGQGHRPRLLILLSDPYNDEPALLQSLGSIDLNSPLLAETQLVVVSSRPEAGTGSVGERLYWVEAQAAQWVASLNWAMGELGHDWVVHLQAGERFHTHSLLAALLQLEHAGECPAVYCDEIAGDAQSGLWPILRSPFNLEQLLSCPAALAGHWLFNRAAVQAVGGFDADYSGAFELDAILRLCEAGYQGFGHISEPVLFRLPAPALAPVDEARAILRHLHARGYLQAQVLDAGAQRYFIDYGDPATPPVAVFVPAIEPFDTLKRCVASLLVLTEYPAMQVVLVQTNATPAGMLEWMVALQAQAEGRVQAQLSEAPLPYNLALNRAVSASACQYLVLLAPACVVVEGQWLQYLLNHALRPEVGAVGARRVQRGETRQDSGLRLGLGAALQVALQPLEAPPLDFVQTERACEVASGACLMLAKAAFEQVGGLDESDFQHRWADADLCLKLRAAGYRNVWTPRAWLALTEPVRNDTPAGQDEQALWAKWPTQLCRDPGFSPHYSADGDGFDLQADAALGWQPLPFKALPLAVVISAGTTRATVALKRLRELGRLAGGIRPGPLGPAHAYGAFRQATVVYDGLALARGYAGVRGEGPLVCDLGSAGQADLEAPGLAATLQPFDELWVASAEQAEACARFGKSVRVLSALAGGGTGAVEHDMALASWLRAFEPQP
ncbi:glycosyltransferase [Pseudomonas sp. NPDC007930]|uniref:glycosyltransferase family 2 protein n=1 Tax=Pseudomonas sp. NPDC007930 TaxID=3364417 RepID=UPI0036E315F7